MSSPKIYTRDGDDGTTGLFYGGRVAKDSELPQAYGAVDEAQAFLGVARSSTASTGSSAAEIDQVITRVESDLYVLMAELATGPENRGKLEAGTTLVTPEMVTAIEVLIDDYKSRFDVPSNFVVPGGDPLSAALDVARTVIRRAEREAIAAAAKGSEVVPYLNRLSDLIWTIARYVEGEATLAKDRL